MSASTIALWARLLREIPDARLILKASQFKDPGTRERIAAAFTAAGIGNERIAVLPPNATTAEHLAAYGRVDDADALHEVTSIPMAHEHTEGSRHWFTATVPLERIGAFGYTVLVLPHSRHLWPDRARPSSVSANNAGS